MATINGTPNADTLNGTPNDDTIFGQEGRDTVYGGDGQDYVDLGQGDRSGSQYADGGAGNDTVVGGDSVDNLFGNSGNDILYGGDGNDTLNGGADNDTVYAGAGDDYIDVNEGNDTVYGGDGEDYFEYVSYNVGQSTLTGGSGVDTYRLFGARVNGGDYYSSWGPDTVTDFQAGVHGDIIRLDQVINYFTGWDGVANPFAAGFLRLHVEDIDGDGQADDLAFQIDTDGSAGGGNFITLLNLLNVNPADFTAQNFTIYGDHPAWNPSGTGIVQTIEQAANSTYEYLLGSQDGDTLTGSNEDEGLYGYGGNDTLYGLGGNDSLIGDTGNDTLYGGAGNDNLDGGQGTDQLYGGDGNDTVYGGAGDDSFYGGAGNDTVYDGQGANNYDLGDGNDYANVNGSGQANAADIYTGGAGRDQYDASLYYTAVVGGAAPTITDFAAGSGGDIVRLTNSNYFDGLGNENPFTNGYLRLAAADVDGDGTVDDTYLQADLNGATGGANWVNVLGFLNKSPAAFGYVFQLDQDNQLFGPSGAGYVATTTFSAVNLGGTRDDDTLTASDYGANLYGGIGDDTLNGGRANDSFNGAQGNDSAYGGDGNDSFDLGDGDDKAYGGAGNDTFYLGSGSNQLSAGTGNDYVYLAYNNATNVIDMGDGNDAVDYVGYASGVDTITLGAGRDGVNAYARIFDDASVSVDVITDFTGGANGDYINLNGVVGYFQGWDSSTNPFTTGYLRLATADVDGDGNSDDTVLQVDRSGSSGGASFTTILAFRNLAPTAFDAYNFLKPNSGGYDSNALSTDPARFIDPSPAGANHAPTADNIEIVVTQNSGVYYQPSIGWAKSLLDQDGDAITATIKTAPSVGTLTFNADGSLNYNVGGTPGDYTFSYTLDDGHTTVSKTGTIHVLSDYNQNFDFQGGIFDDNLGGDSGVNVFHGNGGNDYMTGGEGSDTLYGDAGDDNISGDGGSDILYGGDGNDHLQGGVQTDIAYGGAGDDYFDDYFDGNDEYYGGDGNDTFQYVGYGAGAKSYTGGAGSDNFIIQLGNALVAGHTSTIVDFKPGANGDFLTLDQYTSAFSDFDYQSENAFASGHLTLVQVGADTVLRGDQDGDGSGLVDLIIFKNTTASQFTIDNIRISGSSYGAGVDPHGTPLTITGSALGDGIAGSSGSDVIHGDPDATDVFGGDDNISGGWGADQIYGHAGNDTLDGNEGADSVFGGAGDDTIYGGGGNYADHLEGGSGNDSISGNEGNDTILGGAGDDTLDGGNGNDIVEGGDGNDVFNDYLGNDTLYGGAGDDYFRYALYSSNAQRIITGGTGSDYYDLYGYYVRAGYTDSLTITDFKSGVGGDVLRLQDMSSLFTGWDSTTNPFAGGYLRFAAVDGDGDGVADDTRFQYDIDGDANGHSWLTLATLLNVSPTSIIGANLGTTNYGQGAFWNPDGSPTVITGTDRPDNNNWAPSLIGTLGNDTVYGGGGGETISGLRGNDTLYGGEGGDSIAGNEGNDTLYGDNGDDYLDGNDGNDDVYGGQGNDQVYGSAGNDNLYGGAGDDYIVDYAGVNHIYGGDGADTITAISYLTDVDQVSGGSGRDTFGVYGNAFYYGPTSGDKADVITDFQTGASGDILDLTNWYNGYLEGWDPETNPFSTGYVRFRAVDADADGQADDLAVQADRDGAGSTYGFVTGVTLLNVKAADVVRSQVIFQNGHTWSQTGADGIPDTVSDEYLIEEDTALVVTGPGVLANDTDPQSDALSAILVNNPAHGSLTLNSDGSFTYTPNANFSGTDSFTYRANDGTSPGNIATVTIHVDPSNDAPIANANSYTVQQGSTLSVPDGNTDLLANDVDPDGDALTAALVSGAAHGNVTVNANGSFSYTPDAGYSGTDSFTYRANDGTVNSGPATVTINVQSNNSLPVANSNSYNGTEDQVLTVNAANGVLANDTDADNDALTAELVSQAGGGTVVLNANGSFTFTPSANFNGSTSFTYRANDGHGFGNATTVTLNLAAVNDAPVADADGPYTTNEKTALTVNAANGVLAGDTDVDGNALTAQLVSTTSHGALTLNANGSFSYTPDNGFSGADSFVYHANDGALNSGNVTVTINVVAQNDAPEGVMDNYSVNEDAVLSVNVANGVLANDTDGDGDTLTAAIATGASHGSVSLNANGSLTYSPVANFSGTDSFTYTLSDGTATSGPITVNLTVNPINDAPVSHAEGPYKLLENQNLVVSAANGVLANDTDLDGDTLTAQVVATTAHGTLTLNANGSFNYTPDADYAGSDSFTYVAKDPSGGTSVQQTVQLNVVPPAQFSIQAVDAVKSEGGAPTDSADGFAPAAFARFALLGNSAPTGVVDSYTTAQNSPLAVNAVDGILSNDSDSDGDALTANLITNVAHGTLALNADGSFNYTPNAGFIGTDSFIYRANDGNDDSANTKVTLHVTGIVPPGTSSTGGGWGDVHMSTFDGLNYDFQAVGEFVLVKGTSADDPEVQIRTKPYGNSTSVSVTQGFATEVNGTRISVDINRDAPVYVDGHAVSLNVITPFTFVVNRTGDTDLVQHVSYAVAGDGAHPANAADFVGGVLPTGTLTFNPGETSKTITLFVNGDGTVEPDEGFAVTLSNADNGSSIGTAVAKATILDDDTTPGSGGTSGIGTLNLDLGDGASLVATVTNGNGHYVITYSNGDSFSFDTVGTSYGNIVYTNSDSHATVGLLGSHDGDRTNDISTADGVALGTSPSAIDLYGDFANGWRVTDSTTLFDYPAGKGTADYQDADFPLHLHALSDFPAAIVQQAIDAAAAAGITDPVQQQNAALDLILGGAEFTQGYVAGAPLPTEGAGADVQNDGPKAPTYTAIAPFTAIAEGDSGNTPVTFTVVRTGDVSAAADITYSVAGTVDAADFGGSLPTGTIHFDAGSSQTTLTLNVAGDKTVELDEKLELVLGGLPTGAISIGLAQAIISNDDAPPPPVNQAPAANTDTYKVLEDVQLVVTAADGVLSNDIDADGDTLTAQLVSTTAHGTLVFNGDGSFSYTPDGSYSGSDSFTYIAQDPSGGTSVEQTVQLNVTPPAQFSIAALDAVKFEGGAPTDDADASTSAAFAKLSAFGLFGAGTPNGVADAYSTAQNATLTINAGDGVLANDSDPDGDSLTATLSTGASHGSVNLNADGSFSYTPDAGFVGTDSFYYRANDATDASSDTKVTVTVIGSPPVGTPSTGGGWGDVHMSTFDGLNYDFQAVGEFVLVKGTSADDPEVQIRTKEYSNAVSVTEGIATIVNGTRITVDINRAAPVYIDGKAAAFNEITPFTFVVSRSGDTDNLQHVSYAVAGEGTDGVDASDFVGGVLPSGTLTFNPGETSKTITLFINGDGTIEPDESFAVTLSNADNGALIGTATATGTILDDDANPSSAGNPFGMKTLNLDLGDGASLVASLTNGHGSYVITYANGDVLSFDANGNSYGNVLYTNADSHSTVGLLGSHDGDRTNDLVTVDGVELGISPTASDLYGDFANGWRVTDGTTLFDYPDGKSTSDYQLLDFPQHLRTLSDFPTDVVQQALAAAAAAGITDPARQQNAALDLILGGADFTEGYLGGAPQPTNGTNANVQNDGPQTPTFTAIAPFSAVAEGDSGTSAVTFTVVRTGDLSTAADISYAVAGTVDADDFGGALPTGTIHFDAGSNQATVTLDLAGDTTVEGNETLQLVLSDLPAGAISVGLAQAIIANDDVDGGPTNQTPVANADSYAGTEDTQLVVTAADGVLFNDSDDDGDALIAELVSTTSHGALTFNADGSFGYDPDANFNGIDSFVYHVNDGSTISEDVTVTITVGSVNDTPDAKNDGPYSTGYQTALVVAAATLLANDTDVENDVLTITTVEGATHGTVALNNGAITFTPDAGYSGAASYSYTISDGQGGSDTATVNLTVRPPVVSPLVDRPATVADAGAGNATINGTPGANTFFFDAKAGATGKDRITQFGPDDALVTTRKLADANGDGIITFGKNGVLDLDGFDKNGNQIAIGDIAKKGLRYLGESGDGFYAYASAAVRPKYAKEGQVSHDDVLSGGVVDNKRDIFFVDNALHTDLGDDQIINFGARDLLVTTSKLSDFDNDGLIDFGANGLSFQDGGSLGISNTSGADLAQLEYAGTTSHSGVNYYFYGTPDAVNLNTSLTYI